MNESEQNRIELIKQGGRILEKIAYKRNMECEKLGLKGHAFVAGATMKNGVPIHTWVEYQLSREVAADYLLTQLHYEQRGGKAFTHLDETMFYCQVDEETIIFLGVMKPI